MTHDIPSQELLFVKVWEASKFWLVNLLDEVRITRCESHLLMGELRVKVISRFLVFLKFVNYVSIWGLSISTIFSIHYSDDRRNQEFRSLKVKWLTILGLKGGFTSLPSKATQSIGLKKAWFLMSDSPEGPHPNLVSGFLVRNCNYWELLPRWVSIWISIIISNLIGNGNDNSKAP